MDDKKYPVGTKIIFIAKPFYESGALGDSGKVGVITVSADSYTSIFIPDSKNNVNTFGHKPQVTWSVPWEDIKPLKNYQMLFSFMDK